MGLDLPRQGKETKEMRNGFVLTERLCKTEEGEIVREGDPRAAYVYRGPGRKIPMEEAKALGLVEDKAAQEETAADAEEPAAEPQKEDLSELTRKELNAKAAELGIEKPDKIKGGKLKVIAAIEAAQEETAADAED